MLIEQSILTESELDISVSLSSHRSHRRGFPVCACVVIKQVANKCINMH